jgi:hypothetical protein
VTGTVYNHEFQMPDIDIVGPMPWMPPQHIKSFWNELPAEPETQVIHLSGLGVATNRMVYCTAPLIWEIGAVCGPPAPIAGLDERLDDLREAAEDEGIPYSVAAETVLRQFLFEIGATVRPSLFLMDDGALQAKWANLNGEQIALEFRANGSVRLVYFVRRPDGNLYRGFGTDSLSGALCQSRSLGMVPLMRS